MTTPRRSFWKTGETLVRIALALLEREVLDANELKLIIEGKQLPARVIPQKGTMTAYSRCSSPSRDAHLVSLPGKPSPA